LVTAGIDGEGETGAWSLARATRDAGGPDHLPRDGNQAAAVAGNDGSIRATSGIEHKILYFAGGLARGIEDASGIDADDDWMLCFRGWLLGSTGSLWRNAGRLWRSGGLSRNGCLGRSGRLERNGLLWRSGRQGRRGRLRLGEG
jgi:hypothetical protein